MSLHPIQWFFTNRYVHIRSFVRPALDSDAVPHHLKRRVERRLHNAVRFAQIRIGLYAIIYASVIGTAGSAILDWISDHLGITFNVVGTMFAMVVAVATLLALVAIVGVVLISRTLALLEADIYMLSMEAVARAVHQGSEGLPSDAHVARK